MTESLIDDITYCLHKYKFTEHGISVTVSRFKSSREELWAYLMVEADLSRHPDMNSSHVLLQRQNLSSGPAKEKLARILSGRIDLGTDVWDGIVELISTRSLRRHWEGSDVARIGQLPKRTEVPYLLYPVIRKGSPVILYGAGGIGKSYVSLFFAMLIQHNIQVGMLIPQQANCLILDFESGQDDMNERLSALGKGMGIEAELLYRYCHLPLNSDIDTISRLIHENDIGLVIVDSRGAAVGGQINEARETMEMYNALRSLNVTSLIIDHVSKESNSSPIGSIYNFNEARSIWEMRSNNRMNDGTPSTKIGLYQRKTNLSRRHDPFGLEFTFLENSMEIIDKVSVREIDIAEDSVIRKGLALHVQISEVLKRNVHENMDGTSDYMSMSSDDIASTLDLRKSDIKSILHEGVSQGYDWERKGSDDEWIYKDPQGW